MPYYHAKTTKFAQINTRIRKAKNTTKHHQLRWMNWSWSSFHREAGRDAPRPYAYNNTPWNTQHAFCLWFCWQVISLWERESFSLPNVPLKRPTRRTLTSVTISCYEDRHHQWVLMMICDGKQIALVIWRISSTACKLHEVATHYIVHIPIHKFMHAFKFRAMLVWCLDYTSWNLVLQGSSCCVISSMRAPW